MVLGRRRRDRPAHFARRFAARLTRSVPLDEVLLQLAETTARAVDGEAEVWVAGSPGVFDLRASVPAMHAPALAVTAPELDVLRTGLPRGRAWIEVWLPGVAARLDGAPTRLTPMVHQGEVLGLLLARRRAGKQAFCDRDDLVLADLARQTALALYHARLDSALSETVDRLRIANDELRSSRARLVATAEAERQRLERDLHDGAQQHLVAVSLKVLLARQALERGDRDACFGLLDELKVDAGTALDEVRSLAHGLYPSELATGLGDALDSIAARSPVRVEVLLDGVGRYDAAVEACCFFCCAESVANAIKHAGSDTTITIRLCDEGTSILMSVADDGPGFADGFAVGHGLQNLRDRAGVLGGELRLGRALAGGALVEVRLPLPA
jgi:signal transduction histidine kinase